jgi:hypothetical protein
MATFLNAIKCNCFEEEDLDNLLKNIFAWIGDVRTPPSGQSSPKKEENNISYLQAHTKKRST